MKTKPQYETKEDAEQVRRDIGNGPVGFCPLIKDECNTGCVFYNPAFVNAVNRDVYNSPKKDTKWVIAGASCDLVGMVSNLSYIQGG